MMCPVFSGQLPFENFVKKAGIKVNPTDGCPFMSVLDHRGERLPEGTVFKPNKYFRQTQEQMDDKSFAKETELPAWDQSMKLKDVLRGIYFGWIWGDVARWIEYNLCGGKVLCGMSELDESRKKEEEQQKKEQKEQKERLERQALERRRLELITEGKSFGPSLPPGTEPTASASTTATIKEEGGLGAIQE